jgi:hypothetical protein
MPLGGPFLPQSTIDVIRQWIANGAQKSIASVGNKSILAVETGLRVLTTSPMDNATTIDPVTQIVISFNRDLDINLVNASNVVLEKVDANQTANVATTLTVPESNLQTLLITPTTPLTVGRYQVRLRGSGGGVLASVDAQVVNATADGVAGQDFTLSFTAGE